MKNLEKIKKEKCQPPPPPFSEDLPLHNGNTGNTGTYWVKVVTSFDRRGLYGDMNLKFIAYLLPLSEAYLEPNRTSMMKYFAKLDNLIMAKSFLLNAKTVILQYLNLSR